MSPGYQRNAINNMLFSSHINRYEKTLNVAYCTKTVILKDQIQ